MNYSIPTNKSEDRIEFLEETLESIRRNLVHMGADDSDILSLPFDQWVTREYSKQRKL